MPVSTKILCILDGFGLAPKNDNNINSLAKMPNFRKLLKENYWTTLNADGEMVGQEEGLVGNSEVGHMNIGGLKLVPQLSFQITKSSESGFAINKNLAPDQLFDPSEFLQERWKNKKNTKIRSATSKDIQDIIQIYSDGMVDIFKADLTPEVISDFIQSEVNNTQTGFTKELLDVNLGFNLKVGKGSYFVLEENNQEVLGYLVLTLKENNELKIDDLFIAKNEQGKGFGQFLLEYILEKYNFKFDITLSSNVKNERANNLYEKYGLEIVEVRQREFNGHSYKSNFRRIAAGNYKPKNAKTIHLIGLFSTGTIHSDMRHWVGMIEASLKSGAEKIVLHLMTDGRDSDKKSLVATFEKFEKMLTEKMSKNENTDKFNDWQNKILLGSVGGRFYGMDRDKNWQRVASGLLNMFATYMKTDYGGMGKIEKFLKQKYQIKEISPRLDNFCDMTNIFGNEKAYGVEELKTNLEKIKFCLTYQTERSYNANIFDETIEPTGFAFKTNKNDKRREHRIEFGDTVCLINFRSDRMKQFTQMFCDLNTEFDLNLNILALNDYGDGNALEIENEKLKVENKKGYYPIFKSQAVQRTLAEIISKMPRIETENETGKKLEKEPNLSKREIINKLKEIQQELSKN